jgi:carboxyl-terminal processing protease
MHEVVALTRQPRVLLGVALALVGVLAGGCARQSVGDPVKARLLRQIHDVYLFDVEDSNLEDLSVPEVVARLDADSRLVEARRMSLAFIRGVEPEGSVVDVRALGGGRAYLRLVFFGRRTLADVRQALNGFASPLCALTIDLRDNAGGSFEQALRLAEVFLPPGVPLAIYEDREGRELLYATGTAAPRQERLTILINARTASSAELFAGVLQWHRRAELGGLPTAGKRTVQSALRLDQEHLLFLTTGRFLAPNGVPFGVNGLTPDRRYEGDDALSLMAPCADTKPTESEAVPLMGSTGTPGS